jgi:hypothetical protein
MARDRRKFLNYLSFLNMHCTLLLPFLARQINRCMHISGRATWKKNNMIKSSNWLFMWTTIKEKERKNESLMAAHSTYRFVYEKFTSWFQHFACIYSFLFFQFSLRFVGLANCSARAISKNLFRSDTSA